MVCTSNSALRLELARAGAEAEEEAEAEEGAEADAMIRAVRLRSSLSFEPSLFELTSAEGEEAEAETGEESGFTK
jgi:hypothetical protein